MENGTLQPNLPRNVVQAVHQQNGLPALDHIVFMSLRHMLAHSLTTLSDIGNAYAVSVGEEFIKSPNYILKEGQRFTPISRIALAVRQECIVRDEKRIIGVTEHILHERRFADASAPCHGHVTSGHGLDQLL